MKILGISAFYHDSAACLLEDGELISAAQEERFTRKKHDDSFPINAINYCLKNSNIKGKQIDIVAFYDKPFLKYERIMHTYLSFAPFGVQSYLHAMPAWIKQKLWIKEIIRSKLNYSGKIIFPEHHESHAASAFFPSPFKKAAFLTIDGVGEWTTTSFGIGEDNHLTIFSEIHFPHSLGLLYSAFTYYLGFKVNSGEYKVMGLAPYGEPKYKSEILDELIDLKGDGSFRLNMKYFNYCTGLTMTNRYFDMLFGGPPRKPESRITQKHMDIARSIQDITEEVMVRMTRKVYKETKLDYLCLAGGVALNCVGNSRILKDGHFKKIWIQPASGDAGGAIGCAYLVWYLYLKNKRTITNKRDCMKGTYLGPIYDNSQISQSLNKLNAKYKKLNKKIIFKSIAGFINQQKVIGLFQGRMEFGPRALGNRSIIGDARSSKMQKMMNLKIKFRESFRPFAPSVIKEKASEYFDIECESPYMLYVALVKKSKRLYLKPTDKKLVGLERLKPKLSIVPAITHVDYSARLQTVNKLDNPFYHALITEFDKTYHCPVIINTSFNVRGEPIVCTPEDAYKCFMSTDMDYLIMGDFLIDKKDQPKGFEKHNLENRFALD